MAIVSAPAGSGKTTFLSEWWAATREAGTPAAWLSLDPVDDTPSRFVAHLLAALDLGCPGAVSDALRLARANRDAPIDELVARAIEGLARSPRGAALVLDDYHEIRAEAVHGAVDLLVRHAPPSVSLVLGTRHAPPLSLERLRVRGEVVEVRWDDLRLTVDEVRTYLRDVCGLPLVEDQIRALCHRTEGWITALQLAAMSLAGAADADRLVSSFTGAQPEMAAYLMEDVLRREPPRVRDFLLRTAALDAMTAPLCDAVTGGVDGQQVLEGLVRKNLFTFALDERRTWFRYHHLFLDFLRGRLAAEPPDRVEALHERASEWYERSGALSESVHHAISGRRFPRAARLLERAGRAQFRQGSFKELRRTVEALPDDIVRGSPTLCVLHAWALAYLGEFPAARERIAAAEAALAAAPPGGAPAPIPLHAELRVLRAILSTIEDDDPGAHAVGRDVEAEFPEDERALRAFAAIASGYRERARGDLEVALRRFEAAVELAGATDSSLIDSLARLNVVAVNRLLARHEAARRAATSSLGRARDRLWGRTFGAALLRYALALVVADENRPAEAVALLGEAVEILEASDCFGFIGMALVERGRSHAALRDVAAAASDLARAREVAAVHGVRRVSFHADVLDARLAIRAGEPERAAACLDRAARALDPDPHAAVLSEREETLRVEQVRLAIAAGRPGDAVRLAGTALRGASSSGRRRKMIELLLLQGVAWSALGDGVKAADKVSQALRLSEEGIVRPFVDAGPALLPILSAVCARPDPPPYAERLVAALSPTAAEPSPRPPGPAGADDRLHVRETQILDLIARGLRNREIGERLFLSEETVKWYVKRLFAKLDVRSRTEAVAVARRRGLVG